MVGTLSSNISSTFVPSVSDSSKFYMDFDEAQWDMFKILVSAEEHAEKIGKSVKDVKQLTPTFWEVITHA
ncbi:MAG: hypothetical protein M0R68_15720 [Bacteroidetes bacterium]|nr:hypothetical protein [Bacteroidota bacterium]